MQVPWYYNSLQPTLKHQRNLNKEEKEESSFGKWYKKGVNDMSVAKRYRPGACENCGAMTHKKKDCLEKPRKLGAKWTGKDIAPDEFVNDDLGLDFESKRDRWNGYNIAAHKSIIDSYEKVQEVRKQLLEDKMNEKMKKKAEKDEQKEDESGDDEPESSQPGTSDDVAGGSGVAAAAAGVAAAAAAVADSDSESDADDEDKYGDEIEMPGQKFESEERITVRNLRVREDIAKYLYNLDPNSAYYDPKTRSMRDDPFEDRNRAQKGNHLAFVPFKGDNASRVGGGAREFAKQQLFAWEAAEQGSDVHLQADPTKAELLKREYEQRKESLKSSTRDEILQKYGGAEHLEAPPKPLLYGQGEHYVEYTREGQIKRGEVKTSVKSSFDEDNYDTNHTSVWGSYWEDGQWGYQCCHSMIRNSYCTGEAGRAAAADKVIKKESDDESTDDDSE